MSEMKLYRISDYEWWAGPSLGETLAEHQRQTGISDEELLDVGHLPARVSDSEMERLRFVRDDGSEVSFREQWEHEKTLTSFASKPFPFAGTE